MQCRIHSTPVWQIVTIFLLLVLTGSSVLAEGGDDWVLVKRFEEQLTKAQKGDAAAMYEVGRMYERGRGTEASLKQAMFWFEKAANGGQSAASGRIGILCLVGQDIPQDYNKAFKYLSEAAKAGVPAAQYFLALMYEEGRGIKANPAVAMTWYRKAADGGYYQARQGINRLEDASRRPARVAAARPTKKPANLTDALRDIVLEGQWQRNGKPSGFLPSSASTCKKENSEEITCLSGELKRDTGFAIITYVTVARLSKFNASDEFNVIYYNNVLNVQKKDGGVVDNAFGGTDNVTSQIKTGKQSTEHHLECVLKNQNKIECVKNLTTTMMFENKK